MEVQNKTTSFSESLKKKQEISASKRKDEERKVIGQGNNLPKTKIAATSVLTEVPEEGKVSVTPQDQQNVSQRSNFVKLCSQREGKFTPTKSELGPSQVDRSSKFCSSKFRKMSLMNVSSLLLSQPSLENAKIILSHPESDFVHCSYSSQSCSPSQISLKGLQEFLKDQAGVKSTKKASMFTLSLITCKDKQVIPFKMFRQSDLNFSREFCEQIHYADQDEDYDTDDEIMELSNRRVKNDLDLVFNEIFYKGTEMTSICRNARIGIEF
ncbi:unnamed protein product [Moneuplotes crassus]|uniref:Uncharacterized protein n=1 Tax=Euplotes crassus TaxID=5936 RepID=A0AAD1XIM8_EUPCR|nr:unnamed protein product [Moneuplotes crassus]